MRKLHKKTLGFFSSLCGIAIALLCGISCGEEKEQPVMYGPAPSEYEDVEDSADDDADYELGNTEEPDQQK